MRRRLATTVLAALVIASAGASGAGRPGQDLKTMTPTDPPGAGLPLVQLDEGNVGARALSRANRGRMTTYAYLEREGAGASKDQARNGGSGVSPSAEAQPVPKATGYAVVPGSASPGRASAIPAIAVLFASTLGGLGGLGVLLRRQRTGRRAG